MWTTRLPGAGLPEESTTSIASVTGLTVGDESVPAWQADRRIEHASAMCHLLGPRILELIPG
jgi:hypothetical protein